MAAKTQREHRYLDIKTSTSAYGDGSRYFTVAVRPEAVDKDHDYRFFADPESRIRVHAQQDAAHATETPGPLSYARIGQLYAWTITFSTPYNQGGGCTLQEARDAVATLGKLERGLDTLATRLGPCETFAQYVARIGHLIGADGYIVDGDHGWRGPFMNAGDMAEALEKAERAWRETFAPKAETEAI